MAHIGPIPGTWGQAGDWSVSTAGGLRLPDRSLLGCMATKGRGSQPEQVWLGRGLFCYWLALLRRALLSALWVWGGDAAKGPPAHQEPG